MKTICLIFILSLNAVLMHAQNVTPDSVDIYYQSLKMHLEYLRTQMNYNATHPDKTVYIQEDAFVSKKQYNIDDYKIMIVNTQQIKEKAKKESFLLVVFRPIEITLNGFIINLIDFVVTSKKNDLNYSNSGGSQFVFNYDCNKQKFILKNK